MALLRVALGMLAAVIPAHQSSALTLPPVFSDGLVLQTWAEGDARSFVYGSSEPGQSVSLKMDSSDAAQPYSKTYTAAADSNTGAWAVQLDGTYISDPMKRHGPKVCCAVPTCCCLSLVAMRHAELPAGSPSPFAD
jgi:hypothetical protein